MLRVQYIVLFLTSLILIILLIPLVFLVEIQFLPHVPQDMGKSFEISIGDALTIASIVGAMGVFIVERYWTAQRQITERRYGGALRLVLKHAREQDEPKFIEEHWKLFIGDEAGRKLYCDGAFEDMTLDEFTAEIYTLRIEGQIDLTHGGQVILRTAHSVKAKKLSETEKLEIISLLETLSSDSQTDIFVRKSAIRDLSALDDPTVLPIVQSYLSDDSPEIRLAAIEALIDLVIFPEKVTSTP